MGRDRREGSHPLPATVPTVSCTCATGGPRSVTRIQFSKNRRGGPKPAPVRLLLLPATGYHLRRLLRLRLGHRLELRLPPALACGGRLPLAQRGRSELHELLVARSQLHLRHEAEPH